MTETAQTIRPETRAGDPFYFAGMTASERDRAAREHYAPEYVIRLRRIMQEGCKEPEEEENE